MPWSMSKLPDSANSLTNKQKEIFIEVANSVLEETNDEGQAIASGLAKARDFVEKATASDVERLPNGNIKYRGDVFPGFNKPMKDSGDKQGKVLAKKGDQIKVIRFGDPSLEDNQSKEQRDAFVARFSGQDGWDDPFSALYWSQKWLWPSDQRGTKEFFTVKKSLGEFLEEQLEKYFGGSQEEDTVKTENVAKSVNTEKRLFTAVVLRPNVPDAHGDIYDEDTVEKACHSFSQFCRKANLQHIVDVENDAISFVENYVAPQDFQLGEGMVMKGDWVATAKVNDDEIWKMCKDGTFTGFSVGCLATTEKIND